MVLNPERLFSEYPLPFIGLSPARFESLCLMWAVEKRGLQNYEHPGDAGADQGADILGTIKEDGELVKVAIQAKRYEKLSPQDALQAFKKFYSFFRDFKGQFWIVTCAKASKTTRDKLKEAAIGTAVSVSVIDGSSLECDVRSSPTMLKTFFRCEYTSQTCVKKAAAERAIKSITALEKNFLLERAKSTAALHEGIRERKKIMNEISQLEFLHIAQELNILGDKNLIKTLSLLEKEASAIIRDYQISGEMDAEGRPIFGASQAAEAEMRREESRKRFVGFCSDLIAGCQSY